MFPSVSYEFKIIDIKIYSGQKAIPIELAVIFIIQFATLFHFPCLIIYENCSLL